MKPLAGTLLALLFLLTSRDPLCAVDTAADISQQVASATDTAKQTLKQVESSAKDQMANLSQTVGEAARKYSSFDEILAWVIMGLLVGSVLSRLAGFKPAVAFCFGLLGAVLGGLLVHFSRFDLGLNPVTIKLEDLIFSLVGALVLAVLARLALRRKAQKT